jgi:geranylgeranyl pyrophosphate synthase
MLKSKGSTMKNERLAEKALAILCAKSEKALKMTKKMILEEKLTCKKANDALQYYVSIWNDTTRPGVLSLAHEAVGGKTDKVVPLQAALLFIDAAMDIHDDIIDRSVTKDSKETVYGRFGEETALLIGNAFLVKGFDQLYQEIEKLPLDRKLSIINATKNFLFEVIDAHIYEAELKNKKWTIEPKEYLHVLEQKAADIEGHMRTGAIFGGGSTREIEALSMYGRCLGILLTVRSDFIDIFEPAELMNRAKYECLPLPVLYVLKNNNCRSKIRQILSKERISEDDANELIETIYKTPEFSNLKRYLKKIKQNALVTLNNLRREEPKYKLEIFANSTLEDL